ncbi:uncharacterized protein V1518DRAFT_421423 [Limtongia smithiae]|uniref:uncharacterized protein n=1 Tax=Limtongia smithiae TaxID=1125753 RepID=UPI0034CFE734
MSSSVSAAVMLPVQDTAPLAPPAVSPPPSPPPHEPAAAVHDESAAAPSKKLGLGTDAEMMPLAHAAPDRNDDDIPGPSPMPRPLSISSTAASASSSIFAAVDSISRSVTPSLQSILEQFDPLSFVSGPAPEEKRPSLSRRTSTMSSGSSSASSSSRKRISLAAPSMSSNDSATHPPRTSSRMSISGPPPSASTSSSTSYQRDAGGELSESTEKNVQQDSLPKPEDQPAELPFDFQRFLNQLRNKGAEPLSRYLKSFLQEFGKRSWTVREQVKIVQDFQTFIDPKIPQYPPFTSLPDTEIANAIEGMEKLIMNRLYSQTFSPQIPHSRRTFSHEEDILRDRVLEEKMRIWSWIEADHLDVDKNIINSGKRFILLAQDELLKIGNYRAPRDKVICILNCCKVIFGLLRQTKTEESADKFLPILIYVVLKAAPKHLISNVQYIMRFRSPDKLNGEAGYYLSSLQGAISFIETLDRNSLNITDEEFDEMVTKSVAQIQAQEASSSEIQLKAESPRESQIIPQSLNFASLLRSRSMATASSSSSTNLPISPTSASSPAASAALMAAATAKAEAKAKADADAEFQSLNANAIRTQSPPSRPFSPSDVAGVATEVASQVQEALSATFTAPFKQFSKLFETDDSSDTDHEGSGSSSTTTTTRPAGNRFAAAARNSMSSISARRSSVPAPPRPPQNNTTAAMAPPAQQTTTRSSLNRRSIATVTSLLNGFQSSVSNAVTGAVAVDSSSTSTATTTSSSAPGFPEAISDSPLDTAIPIEPPQPSRTNTSQKVHQMEVQERKEAVDNLVQMFPNLEVSVIESIVLEKQGRVSAAVDACLQLTTN